MINMTTMSGLKNFFVTRGENGMWIWAAPALMNQGFELQIVSERDYSTIVEAQQALEKHVMAFGWERRTIWNGLDGHADAMFGRIGK